MLGALAIGGIGCGSANSSVSEGDVESKQEQMIEATEKATGKSESDFDTRN